MKNKRKIISIIATLLCICMVICSSSCSSGLTDKFKDILGEETETQGGSNYVPDKKPVLVNPNDTSSGDGSSTGDSSSTDNGTSGGGLVSYKEVLNQDSEEVWVGYILNSELNHTVYVICTDALLPDTDYLIEWSLPKDEYPLIENLEIFYSEEYEKYGVYLDCDYDAGEAIWVSYFANAEGYNKPETFLENSISFTSGPSGSLFAFWLLYSEGTDQAHAEKCVDLISDNLLLRISKVE